MSLKQRTSETATRVVQNDPVHVKRRSTETTRWCAADHWDNENLNKTGFLYGDSEVRLKQMEAVYSLSALFVNNSLQGPAFC